MALEQKQIKFLKKLGHDLSPVVTVADRGLVETVVDAIDEALEIHELIKVKVRFPREERQELYTDICQKLKAHKVQTIGMIILLYRPSKANKISLPGPKPKL